MTLYEYIKQAVKELEQEAYWREQWAIAIQDDNERLREQL